MHNIYCWIRTRKHAYCWEFSSKYTNSTHQDFEFLTAKENDVMIMKWKLSSSSTNFSQTRSIKTYLMVLQTPTTLCKCIRLHKVQNGQTYASQKKKELKHSQLTNRDIIHNTERYVETTQLSNQIIKSETSSWASWSLWPPRPAQWSKGCKGQMIKKVTYLVNNWKIGLLSLACVLNE